MDNTDSQNKFSTCFRRNMTDTFIGIEQQPLSEWEKKNMEEMGIREDIKQDRKSF